MNWNRLDSLAALDQLIHKSQDTPIVIFKHSMRCSLSAMALNRMLADSSAMEFYVLDIIAKRDVSNELAQRFKVIHQSPQVLIIYKGACLFDTSHQSISPEVVQKQLDLIS